MSQHRAITGILWPIYANTYWAYCGTIGLYREIAIAIQKESGDSNGVKV